MLTLFIYQGLSLVILCKDVVEGPSDSTILSTLAEVEDCEASETLILATEDHPGPFQTNCAVLSRSFIFFSSSKPARRIRGWPWGVTGPGLEVWEDHLDSLNDSHLVGVILQSPDGSGETEFRYLKFSPSVTSGSLQASTPCFCPSIPNYLSSLLSLSEKSPGATQLPCRPAGRSALAAPPPSGACAPHCAGGADWATDPYKATGLGRPVWSRPRSGWGEGWGKTCSDMSGH